LEDFLEKAVEAGWGGERPQPSIHRYDSDIICTKSHVRVNVRFQQKIKRGNKTFNGHFVSADLMWIFEDEKKTSFSQNGLKGAVFF
jgi:hypothetical protein